MDTFSPAAVAAYFDSQGRGYDQAIYHQQKHQQHPHQQQQQQHRYWRPNSSEAGDGRYVSPAPFSTTSASLYRGIGNGAEYNRFSHIPFESFVGQLYALSLDQHGCRYLQTKLSETENSPEGILIVGQIFREIYPHVVDLMTDPFGNYLCQRLIEHVNSEQLGMIIESVGPSIIEVRACLYSSVSHSVFIL